MNVYVTSKANGVGLACETTVAGIVGVDLTDNAEAFSFGMSVLRTVDPATGLPTAGWVHWPIVIRQRIDKCSP